MLESIIRLSIDRRVAVIFATLVVAIFGLQAWRSTPIEAFPDVTNAQVQVIAQLPGYAPEEVERRVTVPLERALNGTPGMIALRSESLFGLSLVTLTFDDDADPFIARTLVDQRAATAELPDEVVPVLAPDATPLGKVYLFTLMSDRHDPYELRSELEWRIIPHLRQISGVAEVMAMGGALREIAVEVDPIALDAYGLSLTDVLEAVEGSSLNVGGGHLVHGNQQLVIRSIGGRSDAESLKDLVLTSDDALPIVLGDIARITQSATPPQGTVGLNDMRDVVEGFVIMRRNENPSLVLDAIQARIDELQDHILPEGMRIEVFYDRSELVGLTLETTYTNLAHGFLLVVSIVWLFIRSWVGTLAVALIIPLSLFTAFIGLSLMKLPANLISMGAIDFGILVDGAVILVEAVLLEIQKNPTRSRRELFQRIFKGAVSVGKPTFYAMAIIVTSLLPIFALERVEGRIFKPLALTYAFALIGALVFALTMVPALLAIMLKSNKPAPPTPKSLVWLADNYRRIVHYQLRRPLLLLPIAATPLIIGAISLQQLGTEFLPELDEGDLNVFIEMPPSIDLHTGQDILLETRRLIMQVPEVMNVLTNQGRPEDGTDNEAVNMGATYIRLKPREAWRPGMTTESITAEIRELLITIPGLRLNFSQPIKDSIEEAVSGVRGQVVLKVFGHDLKAMRQSLEDAKTALSNIEGVVDLDLYRDAETPQLQILLDRKALAREGIHIVEAQNTIESALAGQVVSEIFLDERPVPVRVMLGAEARAHIDAIRRVPLSGAGGARVPLSEVASVEIGDGRASINREEGDRFLALKFNVSGRDLGSVVQEAIAKIDAEVPPPAGHWFVWGGEFQNQERAVARLKVVVPIALLIVVALLYSALRTARSTFAILLMTPIGLTGGALGLALVGIPLSVSAAVGFIALLGQVSLMGLLLLSSIEDLRREDPDLGGRDRAKLKSHIADGASRRLRPLLLAALLGMLGLVPMVLAQGVGSETSKPFATVIVSGLVTTLLASLFILPGVYALIAPRRPGEIPPPDDENGDDDHDGPGPDAPRHPTHPQPEGASA